MNNLRLVISNPLPDAKLFLYPGILTEENIQMQTTRLKAIFPELKKEWFDILYNFLKEENFTDTRLMAAVNYCRDNCPYRQPPLAWILSFGKDIEVFNYGQMLKKESELGEWIWKDYTNIEIDGKSCWCSNADYDKYKFKKFIPIPFGTKK